MNPDSTPSPARSDAVVVDRVSYTYPGVPYGRTTLRDRLSRRGMRPTRTPVLRDVSFRAAPGHCLGIIGRNGVGKSTLLKLLVGALRPDAGDVTVNGRIAPIIGLGSGLHPEYDADANAVLIGTAMGNRLADVRARLDEIMSFAGLTEHRHEPVRRYSSGMLARLSFAVATMAQPDVLLIDEVLGVGDHDFAVKARKRITELMQGDTATILVSHDLGSIRSLCDSALWLDEGRVGAYGTPTDVIGAYLDDWKRRQEGACTTN